MTDFMKRISFAHATDGLGGSVATPAVAAENIKCRLVTKLSGRETEEERRLFARAGFLLRFPYNVTLRENQQVRINGVDYDVLQVIDVRSEPHVQNLAGLSIRR